MSNHLCFRLGKVMVVFPVAVIVDATRGQVQQKPEVPPRLASSHVRKDMVVQRRSVTLSFPWVTLILPSSASPSLGLENDNTYQTILGVYLLLASIFSSPVMSVLWSPSFNVNEQTLSLSIFFEVSQPKCNRQILKPSLPLPEERNIVTCLHPSTQLLWINTHIPSRLLCCAGVSTISPCLPNSLVWDPKGGRLTERNSPEDKRVVSSEACSIIQVFKTY